MDCAETLKTYLGSIHRIEKEHLVPLISITAAATTLLSCYYYATHKRKKHQQYAKKIPIPNKRYPYIGHLFSLGSAPHKTISAWHETYGPIIQIKMGIRTWISIDEPELCHKVFVTNGVYTSSRPYSAYGSVYSLNGKGIVFSQPSGEWKKSRAAALAALATKQIDDKYLAAITEQSEKLVYNLMSSTEKKGSINPFKYLELNSLNVIFQSGFGEAKQFDSIDDPAFIELADINETSLRYGGIKYVMSNYLPIFSIIDYFIGPREIWKRFIKSKRDPLYRRLVQEALVSEGPNFVKTLDQDFHMTEDEKIVLMSDLTAAGTDTTAKTLAWIFAILCHHPTVQKTVAEEIDEFIKAHQGRLPVLKERQELPYCISVIKECMRYRPTTFLGLTHFADEEFEVDGYIIPKGATVVCNMDSIHKNRDRYPDRPLNFVPERFLDNTKTMYASANGRLADRDHFNFGWGRRLCPAVYLAEVEIFCAFIQIFSRCFIEPSNDGEYPNLDDAKIEGVVLSPSSYRVKFARRADALI